MTPTSRKGTLSSGKPGDAGESVLRVECSVVGTLLGGTAGGVEEASGERAGLGRNPIGKVCCAAGGAGRAGCSSGGKVGRPGCVEAGVATGLANAGAAASARTRDGSVIGLVTLPG